MIELDHVTLTYPDGVGRVTAVDDVSLTVRPGTVTALTGPSGSGKSSVLAVAATLVRPDAGRVLIDGEDVTGLDPAAAAELRRDRVGIVFQQANLLPSLTTREQLVVMNELGRAGARGRRVEARQRADELLEAVGLDGLGDRRPHQLSGGQRQRINIARALMNRPAALLVDEPTSALDQEAGAGVVDLIVALSHAERTATLLVTHDVVHLPRVHGLVEMLDGRVGEARDARYSVHG